MMKRNEHHLKEQLAQLTAAVRKKYKEFKDGTVASEDLLVKRYKPLITELKKDRSKAASAVKAEPKEEESYDADETYDEAFLPEVKSTPKFISDGTVSESGPSDKPSVSNVMSTPEGRETASRYIEETFTHPLTRKYMKKLMTGIARGSKRDVVDHVYGPRYEQDTLMVGNKSLTFEDDGKIVIDGVSYRPTDGLYELLFKYTPDDRLYNDNDLKAYRDILLKTNAHKKGYNYRGQVNRIGKSTKYKMIIGKLFPPQVRGRGLTAAAAWKATDSRDIVHWDDPNELVERFRVLVASTETGNRAHRNEMLNIVEELREAGIIRGAGNSRFKSLLQ